MFTGGVVMGAYIDITGKIFNDVEVLSRVENNKHNKAKFKCKCHCGNEFFCLGSSLKSGNTKSCGCLSRANRRTHGGTGTKLYYVWHDMIRRCYNTNHKNYKRYGYRGIKVCLDWKSDFSNFKEWSVDNGYKEGLSIDRIDNNGNYEPSNCRWVDMKVQSNNRSNTIWIYYNEEVMRLSELAEINNIDYFELYEEYRKGKLQKAEV